MSNLDEQIDNARRVLDGLLAERRELQEAERQRQIALNPWKVGDHVTTKLAYRNSPVIRVTPKAVVVREGWGDERIPLHRVLPADPKKEKRARWAW